MRRSTRTSIPEFTCGLLLGAEMDPSRHPRRRRSSTPHEEHNEPCDNDGDHHRLGHICLVAAPRRTFGRRYPPEGQGRRCERLSHRAAPQVEKRVIVPVTKLPGDAVILVPRGTAR